MTRLNQRAIIDKGHLLRLKAKLQSVQWTDVPEELKALVQNLKEIVLSGGVGHGGYSNHLTTLEVDGNEYTRLVQSHKSDPKFIPSAEVFISKSGFCHFHVILTFVGQHDNEVDQAVASDLVNYICSNFDDPMDEITIVIHRRWKKNASDRKASYTTALWGGVSLTALNERLIWAQQQIAVKLKAEHNAIVKHLEQISLAVETDPKKMEEYKNEKVV